MRMTQTQAAGLAGCTPRTVRRYVSDKNVSVDERGRVLLSEVKRLVMRNEESGRRRSGRRPKGVLNPLAQCLRVNGMGQLYLNNCPILVWNTSGKVIPLLGTPCRKGDFTHPSLKDIEYAMRFLEIRILAHMMSLAKQCLTHGIDSVVLAVTYQRWHAGYPYDLFHTPPHITEEKHLIHIVPRPGVGYIEITKGWDGELLHEASVEEGKELGDLLPLAHKLDQILAGVSSDHIRVLTALFISNFLRMRKPSARRYCATKAQRNDQQRYEKIKSRMFSKPEIITGETDIQALRRQLSKIMQPLDPRQLQVMKEGQERLARTKHAKRLSNLVHEGVTRHGYTLEWLLGVSGATVRGHWKPKLRKLMAKLRREFITENPLSRRYEQACEESPWDSQVRW